CDQPVDAQTDNLYDTIRNNVNTTKFADFIDALEMKREFVEASCTSSQPQCLTVFVPNNQAVELIIQLPQWNELSLASKRLVIWGHILKSTKRITAVDWSQMGTSQNLKDVGFGTGRSVSFGFSITHYAFQSQLGTNLVYFIDVARLVQPDISASNGMVHVINQMLFMPWENTNFYEYISQQKNL
ncbi:fasciclin domain protein, partial [Opisthorchis viverrini]